jgi:RimJ/RimL family protein N-acetyltransferase
MADFWRDGDRVPKRKATERLALRPLRATDVERDYDAVMSSAAELRRWSASPWPADGFTLAENLADLERHEREHKAREAFTYTVLDPAEERCLGCVYILPAWDNAAALCAGASRAACVGFWVRTSEIPNELDRHLLATLLNWFEREWAFDIVLLTSVKTETRQVALLAESGLERLPLSWPDGYEGWGFRARFALHPHAA